MATLQYIRALNRSAKVRVKNSSGNLVTLTVGTNTEVDIDDAVVQRQLNRHSAIGQWHMSEPHA